MTVDDMRLFLIENKQNRNNIKDKIYNARNFRDACILSKYHLTPQSYGEVLNVWLRNHYNFKKISASLKQGDDLIHNEYKTEVKISIADDGKQANFVQIRLTHGIDFYLLIVYNMVQDSMHYFLVNKEDMKDLIVNYGGLAHGTKGEKGLITENLDNPDIEHALRPKIGTQLWNDIQKFSISEEEINEKSVWKKRKEKH
jgi:hypothetical protein